ncbi:MAG TPA: peptidase U62 [Elusimicrobia bacterium]|nr:MAG: hypothetical protein A2X37_12385 [Elusimicrobia bacterium GWA2_66_18]OGR73664.1 MAG: hypothetical protein A2X40_07985 [Elusimicrobia bacterium GWC2_65_9]HAZ07714.1 peptidase U62 [Elusimicrobiota bacterium]
MKSRRSRRNSPAPLVLAALLCAAAAQAETWGSEPTPAGEVLKSMESELARNLSRLKQDRFGPPYFLAYRLHDARRYDVGASLGEFVNDEVDDYRVAYVEARYGGSDIDNTDLNYQGVSAAAPADPAVLSQTFWQLTDQAYKGALSGWLEKKAKRATELVTDVLDDFSIEPSTVAVLFPAPPALDRDKLKGLARRLSEVFRDYPEVHESNASVTAFWARRFLVTSEGTRLLTLAEEMPQEVRAYASTRAEDGMKLEDSFNVSLRSFDDLPPEAELMASARRVASELTALRRAPVQDAAAAPAILDPEMSGVLFHEALGHKLEGQRQRDPRESQVFRDLLGKRIIPDFLSVIDDPTLKAFQGAPLHGSYDFDSEGTPARRAVLVEHGILREFLMSRWPVKGFSRANGHGRSDWRAHPSGRMANLIVEARGAVPPAELERRLLEAILKAGKPYGFLLVGAFGGENPTTRDSAQTLEVRPRLAYRVDAKTGRKTLVRGVKLVGTPLVVLNRILAAGDDIRLSNGFQCGAESGWVPVSQTAPSLLLSEVELQRLPEDRSRPPILPSPLHDRR